MSDALCATTKVCFLNVSFAVFSHVRFVSSTSSAHRGGTRNLESSCRVAVHVGALFTACSAAFSASLSSTCAAFCFVLYSLICSAIAFARTSRSTDFRIWVSESALTSASVPMAARVFLLSLAVFNAASTCCARISFSSSFNVCNCFLSRFASFMASPRPLSPAALSNSSNLLQTRLKNPLRIGNFVFDIDDVIRVSA